MMLCDRLGHSIHTALVALVALLTMTLVATSDSLHLLPRSEAEGKFEPESRIWTHGFKVGTNQVVKATAADCRSQAMS